jgi:hypothetical protein
MKLVEQGEYRGHTLLMFEERVHEPRRSHWIVIAPDGINILGDPKESEAAARAFVDRIIESDDRNRTR